LRTEQQGVVTEFSKHQKEVLERLETIQLNLTVIAATAEATAKATAASTLKGLPYQEAVHTVMKAQAAALGDEYDDTSAMTGRVSGSKKGDGLLTVLDQKGAPEGVARVVLEMTDSVARRDWVKYFEECERNRDGRVPLGSVLAHSSSSSIAASARSRPASEPTLAGTVRRPGRG